MILQAQVEIEVDLTSSILIGDKSNSILTGIIGIGKNLLFVPQRTV
jgi:hypothetical protein